jgi:hypothetical protein
MRSRATIPRLLFSTSSTSSSSLSTLVPPLARYISPKSMKNRRLTLEICEDEGVHESCGGA